MYVGKAIKRKDAYDKVTGRAKFTDDLCDKSAYIVRIVHSTIAHGKVLSFDTAEAERVRGVVRILTCFDLKEKHYYSTPGHPYVLDPTARDVEDRLVLTDTVRFYGDDIAAVVAEDEVAARQALSLIRVSYEEYPFVLDVEEAMKDGAPRIHQDYPGNILAHTSIREGDYAKAVEEAGLIRVEGWYETPMIHHCHLENHICYAEMEQDRNAEPVMSWSTERASIPVFIWPCGPTARISLPWRDWKGRTGRSQISSRPSLMKLPCSAASARPAPS